MRFDQPIILPSGEKLETLADARRHILKLPKTHHGQQAWQAAIEALLMAAEKRGPVMHANVGVHQAVHGLKPIPEYDSSKEKHWGRRKLARDQ